MRVGALITLSGPQEKTFFPVDLGRRAGTLAAMPDARSSILGNNLRDRTAQKLRRAGVNRPTVVQEGLVFSKLLRDHSFVFDSAPSVWEKPLAEAVRQGNDFVVLVGTTAYADLDYEELLRFHVERGGALTQVYANDGWLDIAVVSAKELGNGNKLASIVAKRERYSYDGYVNRLRDPNDFMKLVEDALSQECALRPAGTEVADGVWMADGAEVDDSCVIGGPSFIGANVRISACCNISGGSSIESACHIDSGTTIETSWVLPNTYVGVGLNVSRSIVNKQKMFHLDRKTEITINDRRLIGATSSLPFFGAGDGLFGRLHSSS